MTDPLKSYLISGLNLLHLSLSNTQINQLLHYITLLEQWNKIHNLTAVRDKKSMITRHLFDSLTIHPYIIGKSILDVGSGPGLPGIPLAILFPQKRLMLSECQKKKAQFMAHVIRELSLNNSDVQCDRVENWHPKTTFFDLIVSRALTTLDQLITMTEHLLKPQGIWLAMKGRYPEKEIAFLTIQRKHPIHITQNIPLKVPYEAGQRHLIIMQREQTIKN